MGFWKTIRTALTALALLAAPAFAQVPDPFAHELAAKLAGADATLAAQGYAHVAGPFSGSLQQGARQNVSVTLRADQDFFVAGVCDNRCGELGVRVVGPGGETLAADVGGGQAAGASLRPVATGVYTLEVDMRRCGADSCWFALSIYTR